MSYWILLLIGTLIGYVLFAAVATVVALVTILHAAHSEDN